MNVHVRKNEVVSALQALLDGHVTEITGVALESALASHVHAGTDARLYQELLSQIFFAMSHPELDAASALVSDVTATLQNLLAFQDSEAQHKVERATRTPVREKAEEGYMICRCGSKRIHWEDRHIRSADEGATLFCECTDCGARWRIGA